MINDFIEVHCVATQSLLSPTHTQTYHRKTHRLLNDIIETVNTSVHQIIVYYKSPIIETLFFWMQPFDNVCLLLDTMHIRATHDYGIFWNNHIIVQRPLHNIYKCYIINAFGQYKSASDNCNNYVWSSWLSENKYALLLLWFRI